MGIKLVKQLEYDKTVSINLDIQHLKLMLKLRNFHKPFQGFRDITELIVQGQLGKSIFLIKL